MSELDLDSATASATAGCRRPRPRPAGWCSPRPRPCRSCRRAGRRRACPSTPPRRPSCRRRPPPSPPTWPSIDTRSPEFAQKVDVDHLHGRQGPAGRRDRLQPAARPARGRGARPARAVAAATPRPGWRTPWSTCARPSPISTRTGPTSAAQEGAQVASRAATRSQRYFAKYESAQSHLNAIIKSLESGQDDLRKDNAAIETEKANMWTTMGKLSEYNQLAAALDERRHRRRSPSSRPPASPTTPTRSSPTRCSRSASGGRTS